MKVSKLFKTTLLLGLITIIFACNTDELESKIAELEAEKIETANQINGKEEMISDFIGSLNEIEGNLAIIKERENIITAKFDKGNMEIDNNMKDEIMGDIDLINDLLLDNRDKMATLNSKLIKSEQESDLKIQELQTMMEGLAVRMQ
ncbi:MAG: hypothetical protein QMB65_10860, partial [Vicingaceae bacterium]